MFHIAKAFAGAAAKAETDSHPTHVIAIIRMVLLLRVRLPPLACAVQIHEPGPLGLGERQEAGLIDFGRQGLAGTAH